MDNKSNKELKKASQRASQKAKTIIKELKTSKQASESQVETIKRADKQAEQVKVRESQARATTTNFLTCLQGELVGKVELTPSQSKAIKTYQEQRANFLETYPTKQERDANKDKEPKLKGELLKVYNYAYNHLNIDYKAQSKEIKADLKSLVDEFCEVIDKATKEGDQVATIKLDQDKAIKLWNLSTSILGFNARIDYKKLKRALFTCYKVAMRPSKN